MHVRLSDSQRAVFFTCLLKIQRTNDTFNDLNFYAQRVIAEYDRMPTGSELRHATIGDIRDLLIRYKREGYLSFNFDRVIYELTTLGIHVCNQMDGSEMAPPES